MTCVTVTLVPTCCVAFARRDVTLVATPRTCPPGRVQTRRPAPRFSPPRHARFPLPNPPQNRNPRLVTAHQTRMRTQTRTPAPQSPGRSSPAACAAASASASALCHTASYSSAECIPPSAPLKPLLSAPLPMPPSPPPGGVVVNEPPAAPVKEPPPAPGNEAMNEPPAAPGSDPRPLHDRPRVNDIPPVNEEPYVPSDSLRAVARLAAGVTMLPPDADTRAGPPPVALMCMLWGVTLSAPASPPDADAHAALPPPPATPWCRLDAANGDARHMPPPAPLCEPMPPERGRSGATLLSLVPHTSATASSAPRPALTAVVEPPSPCSLPAPMLPVSVSMLPQSPKSMCAYHAGDGDGCDASA
eukprot:365318-Chlamydomonas_euryale.AAC.3